MTTDTVELTLKLPPKTVRKLRMLAMGTGKTVQELESELSTVFDEMLSENLHALLHDLDGVAAPTPPVMVVSRVIAPSSPPLQEEEINEDENSHMLSGDADEGDVKSTAERMEEGSFSGEPPVPGINPFELPSNIPNAEGNIEAFIDAAMSSSKPSPQSNGRYTSSKKSFDPRHPRVKISEHTGDEDGEMSQLFI